MQNNSAPSNRPAPGSRKLTPEEIDDLLAEVAPLGGSCDEYGHVYGLDYSPEHPLVAQLGTLTDAEKRTVRGALRPREREPCQPDPSAVWWAAPDVAALMGKSVSWARRHDGLNRIKHRPDPSGSAVRWKPAEVLALFRGGPKGRLIALKGGK